MMRSGTTGHIWRLVPSAMVAWGVTMVIGLIGAAVDAASHDRAAVGELLVIYPVVMSVPFALLIAGVLLPAVEVARSVAGPRGAWLLGSVGVALAPLQASAFLLGGRILFSSSPHARPTVAADLAAVASHPGPGIALLLAFMAGGLVLGVCAAARHVDSGGASANTQMEPTRAGS